MTGEVPASLAAEIVRKLKEKAKKIVRAAQEHAETPGAGVPVRR